MGIRTLFAYLLGSRRAILLIAGDRQAVWIGLVFVFSAALAREYDGKYLPSEWWYLLIPYAAALGNSFLLYTVLWSFMKEGKEPWFTFLYGYRSFLGLFLMTAPLAWLYGIPYERLLEPTEAVSANLWTLAVVSVWRVALMVRVACVFMGHNLFLALGTILLIADLEVVLTTFLTNISLVDTMGGTRRTELEQIRRGFYSGLGGLGCLSLPGWLACIGLGFWLRKPSAQTDLPVEMKARLSIWALTLLASLFWLLLLPFTQPQLAVSHQVKRAFWTGGFANGLRAMSAYRREDLPSGWEPPRLSRGDADSLLKYFDAMATEKSAPWIRDVFEPEFLSAIETIVFRHAPDQFQEKELGAILGKPELRALFSRAIERLTREDWSADRTKAWRQALEKAGSKGAQPPPADENKPAK